MQAAFVPYWRIDQYQEREMTLMFRRNHYAKRNGVWPTGAIVSDMRRLQHDMDFLFGGTRGPHQANYPPLNAWIDDEGLIVTAEIAGVDPENIQIAVENEALYLSGKRITEELPESARRLRRERSFGEFTRTLELPFQIDADSVEATIRNGVLQIVLPRLPEEKPTKITVKAA
jgi:HSP20 family protein